MANTPSTTRRRFMHSAAVGAAALGVATPLRGVRAQVNGANERIGVGFIGCGGRAGSHMNMLTHLRDREKMNIQFVAVCDAYRPRMERAKQRIKAEKSYMDYRELLADKDVDLVCIATPDHWHAQQAIDALEAGKHVYCEKPVSHWTQFDLTKKLYETSKQSNAVFQLGTQAMSDGAWHQMKKLVQDGLIGQPIHGETGFFRVGDWGERGMHIDDANVKPGKDLDWKLWLGDRPRVPHSVDRQFRWRLFMDYAGGPSTDLYPHCLTQVIDI
ncbi:MAG: Gfo/Idh/MocA family oxidoreductase, partial [Rhodospirillales bacterium]|nr:Gfo/Idh/MocA family oxidoreductase [Rhodospirillales bacterium]